MPQMRNKPHHRGRSELNATVVSKQIRHAFSADGSQIDICRRRELSFSRPLLRKSRSALPARQKSATSTIRVHNSELPLDSTPHSAIITSHASYFTLLGARHAPTAQSSLADAPRRQLPANRGKPSPNRKYLTPHPPSSPCHFLTFPPGFKEYQNGGAQT